MKTERFIPEGWREVELREIGSFVSGNGFPLMYQGEKDGELPFYKVSDFNNNNDDIYLHEANNYISLSLSNKLHCNIIPNNSIVFAKIGAAILLERKRLTSQDCCIDNNMMSFQMYKCDEKYMLYVLKTITFGNLVNTTALPALKTIDLQNLKISLPISLSEQQQIATILSAADRAIEQTEELIEKYKNIKKGLMQDLLNPKEGWKMMELESVANIVTGSTPSTQDSSNYGHDYLFVGPGDLGNDIFINKTEKNLSAKGFSLCRKIPKNSILYTCIGSTIGKCGISDCELATNQQINSVIPHKGIDYMYLFYILLSKTEKIKEMAGTQAVPLVNKSLFSQILVPIPDISEQQRIAEILSLVDEQILRLETSLKKQREQKLGLMDDLLTGRVRVNKLLNN